MEPFERRQKLSIYWYNKASDLRASAGAIWFCIYDPQGSKITEDLGLGENFSFGAACFPVYYMLCGLALELLLKATLVEQGKDFKLTHNLPQLATESGLILNKKEIALLQILSEYIYWDGKYPIPKDEKDYWDTKMLKEENLFTKTSGADSEITFLRRNDELKWKSFNLLWKKFSEHYYKFHKDAMEF